MKVKKGILEFGRFEVPYRIYGDAPRAIVCVSGAQQTMAAWRTFVSKFVDSYSVVVFDAPGQGRSKITSGAASVSLDEQVAILGEIARIAGASQPIHIASASWGCVVAAAFAARAGDTVEKLILGSFGFSPNAVLLETIERGQRLVEAGRGNELGDLLIDCFGAQLPDAYKKRIRDQFQAMNDDQLLSFFAHSQLVEGTDSLGDVIDLSAITAETLIVNGENDTIIDSADVDVAGALIDRCTCRILPDVGHFLHFENTDVLNLYARFLGGGLQTGAASRAAALQVAAPSARVARAGRRPRVDIPSQRRARRSRQVTQPRRQAPARRALPDQESAHGGG